MAGGLVLVMLLVLVGGLSALLAWGLYETWRLKTAEWDVVVDVRWRRPRHVKLRAVPKEGR